jgi:hypothetical protein
VGRLTKIITQLLNKGDPEMKKKLKAPKAAAVSKKPAKPAKLLRKEAAPLPIKEVPIKEVPVKQAKAGKLPVKPGKSGEPAVLKNGVGKAPSAKSGTKGEGKKHGHENRKVCRVIGCLLPATTGGYSRNCYIKYWKQIKKKDEILQDGTLHRYIGEIVDKYPEKIIMAIRIDLADDEGYAQMIRELDLYGGVDELEHEFATPSDEMAMEEAIDDIKSGFTKDEEEF